MDGTVIRREATARERFESKLLPGLTRALTVFCGILSIAWAASSIVVYRAEGPLTTAANDILHGDKFSQEQFSRLRHQLDATSFNSVRPAVLRDIAIVRLRLIEEGLVPDAAPSAVDLDVLEKTLSAALAGNPDDSFLWLMEYRLENLRNGDSDRSLKFLGMSYLSGPYEGWIAVRRESVALRNFSRLPPDLARRVLAEFTLMVKSWYHVEAANMIAGPGWAIHEKLLNGLATVEEPNRRAFAKVLDSKELNGVRVPGIVERPTHPF